MSTTSHPNLGTPVIVPITAGEPVLRHAQRQISILLTCQQITITHARYSADQQGAGPAHPSPPH